MYNFTIRTTYLLRKKKTPLAIQTDTRILVQNAQARVEANKEKEKRNIIHIVLQRLKQQPHRGERGGGGLVVPDQ